MLCTSTIYPIILHFKYKNVFRISRKELEKIYVNEKSNA